MNRAAVGLLLLVIPFVSAQGAPACGQPTMVVAAAGNQQVEVSWSPVPEVCDGTERFPVAAYEVLVYRDGEPIQNRTTTASNVVFVLTNDRAYAFLVVARSADGVRGPPSVPAAATPRFDQDLEYLAAGLIVTWGGLFAYAAFLARKEDRLLKRMDRILNANVGRNPP